MAFSFAFSKYSFASPLKREWKEGWEEKPLLLQTRETESSPSTKSPTPDETKPGVVPLAQPNSGHLQPTVTSAFDSVAWRWKSHLRSRLTLREKNLANLNTVFTKLLAQWRSFALAVNRDLEKETVFSSIWPN